MSAEDRTVYSLERYDTFGNSHATNRDETWTVKRVPRLFKSAEDARAYVREKSFREYSRFLIGQSKSQWDDIIEDFCFGDDPRHLVARRFFVGRPPLKRIARILSDDGVKVRNV